MERTINDIVTEWEEQGQDSQWVPEHDEDTQTAINIIRDAEETRCMGECEGCTGDPDCEHFISRSWFNRNVP